MLHESRERLAGLSAGRGSRAAISAGSDTSAGSGRDGSQSEKMPARNPVRVTIAPLQKSDFPVYLTGLGTVQGFNTVHGTHARRRPDRQDRLQGRPAGQAGRYCCSRSIRGRTRPPSTRPRPRRRRTRPISPTPIWTCSATPSSANSRPSNRPTPSARPCSN